MKLYCFDPKKKKIILAGIYNEDLKIFFKDVKPSHFMVIEKSYGIQDEILQQLKRLGCQDICIKTKLFYIQSKLEDWLKKPIKNYGHGNQRFLGGNNAKR